jgi:lipoprotein-releasing system permease protein
MKLKLLFEIALSLLLARWKQTLVAAIGVTFSITLFVTLLSFMTGLNVMLDSLVINRTPHIRLYRDIKPSKNQPVDQIYKNKNQYNFVSSIKPKKHLLELFNSGSIIHSLKKDSRVLGVAPKVTAQIFYRVGALQLGGVINGIDPEEENRLFLFESYVTNGQYFDLKNVPNSIILGKGAADKILANIGDVIQITTGQGETVSLKVVGYFQSGLQDLDNVQSYASIETTQKILGEGKNYITDIQIKLHQIEDAPVLAKEYERLYETDAIDIQQANSQFETGSSVRKIISYAVGITLLIVAEFGIYNILNMMIYEKMDSIAIMKATGFSGKDVQFIFISIALGIGIFGGLFGLIFGYGLSAMVDQIPFNTSALPTIKTYLSLMNLISI